jgi:ATP-dependent Lon protease
VPDDHLEVCRLLAAATVNPSFCRLLLEEPELALRTSVPGVATGLAYTPFGGDIIFIEATSMPGKGNLILTGQIGDIMKESAQTALSFIRSKSKNYDIDEEFFSKNDIHIHVPSGAIPKDGPSAGIPIFISLYSLLKGKKVRHDIAMTGEITLRGIVLPVGGIKEKVLAAKQAGIADDHLLSAIYCGFFHYPALQPYPEPHPLH